MCLDQLSLIMKIKDWQSSVNNALRWRGCGSVNQVFWLVVSFQDNMDCSHVSLSSVVRASSGTIQVLFVRVLTVGELKHGPELRIRRTDIHWKVKNGWIEGIQGNSSLRECSSEWIKSGATWEHHDVVASQKSNACSYNPLRSCRTD